MLEILRSEVLEANLMLVREGLVKYTWGNVSGIDRSSNLVVIKPSGMAYESLKASDLVIVDLDGNVVEGDLKPSSDTATHLVLYRSFPEIGGITHTHSRWATIFSQASIPVRPLGTTHADIFYGEIPCARELTDNEINLGYEEQTGRVIEETFANKNYLETPAVLLAGHGPFTWGKNALESVMHAGVLEEVCRMNYHSMQLNQDIKDLNQALQDKHFFRKHGSHAYYGQK